MTIVADPKGNLFVQGDDGSLSPAPTMVNEKTGTTMVWDGEKLHPLPGQEPSRIGSALRGVVQGATMGFGDELRAGTDALAQGVGNLIHGSDGRPTMGEAYDASLAKNREQMQIDRQENPVSMIAGQVVGGVGTTIAGGAALGAAGLGARGAATVAPSLGRMVGQGALTGAAAGGVTGFGEGEGGVVPRLEGAGIGAATGAVIGAGTGAAATGASRLISPVRTRGPQYDNLVGKAQGEGIVLSPGEQTGSRSLKMAETNLAQMPFAAGPAEDMADVTARSVNRAVARKADLDADRLLPDVLNKHQAKLGGEIDHLASTNDMQVNAPFAQTLGQVRARLPHMKEDVENEINRRLNQLNSMITIDANGNAVVPGTSFVNLQSDLREAIQGAKGTAQSELIKFRDILRKQMESGMQPADAARWRELNRHYANLSVIKDAMGDAGAGVAEGNISPLSLRRAIESSMGNDAYAMGRGDMNDLARIGQSVLRKPPDSGTAGRTIINQLMTGSVHGGVGGAIGTALLGPIGGAVGGLVGTTLGPRMVQSAMNSPVGRGYLTNQMMSQIDPRVVQAITAAAAQQGAPRNELGPR
jgi:hypothetical protein